MTSFVNHFKQLAPNDAVLYHCDSKIPSVEIAFNEALNPKRWRDIFSPFACAIVHNNSNEIILVRDHLGVEPLYYYHQVGKKLIYADNIPAILQQLSSTPSLVEKQINMLFSHHKIYSDESTKEWVQTGCRTAGIGCVDCKRPVIEAIGRELQPIQEAIKEYEADLGLVKRIVVEGSEQAREEANKTLNDVRDVMKLDY